ncbi:MAG: biotin--[acetyl-CoA-carboxylase] ligase, partial [Xenophilus sp.]
MNATAALSAALAGLLPDLAVQQVDEIDSTNTELMRRARAGDAAPVLLVAGHQTAGRGRVGRGWDSAPGDSLTFSLALPLAPAGWSGLSLAVGVGVAESLDPDGAADLRLKWPNDLWRQDRKLGGILIETSGVPGAAARQVVIGIGLNLTVRPADGLRTPPAAVREWWPGAGPAEVLARIAPALVGEVLRFERE